MSQALEQTERELGKVDIAIANAAIHAFRPLVYHPMEEWWRIVEVNLKGPMVLM